jgi:ketopantoate reductase
MQLLLSALVFLGAFLRAESWIPPHNHVVERSSRVALGMGSRAADKLERKREWLAKRGGAADDATSLVATEIIGAGRIGSLLAQAGSAVVLGRDDTIDAQGTGPILIATRNDSLDGIVEACPEIRRKDLVFVQNGYLDNFLASKGLLDNTQVLLYLSVTAQGVAPIDGVTTVNPEGLTAATGVHASAFADRLAAMDLKCEVVDPTTYRPAMFEKLIWISTYMLVGTAKECASVGQAGSDHAELVQGVVAELVAVVSAAEGIVFPEGTMERLAAYTDVVTDFPCAVKEFEWRNKYFFDLGDEACPTHNGLLRECAEKGFLSFELA